MHFMSRTAATMKSQTMPNKLPAQIQQDMSLPFISLSF